MKYKAGFLFSVFVAIVCGCFLAYVDNGIYGIISVLLGTAIIFAVVFGIMWMGDHGW